MMTLYFYSVIFLITFVFSYTFFLDNLFVKSNAILLILISCEHEEKLPDNSDDKEYNCGYAVETFHVK